MIEVQVTNSIGRGDSIENITGLSKKAVEKICEFANSDKDKVKIYISAGLGKTDIIVSALREILTNGSKISIAILLKRRTKQQ